MSETEELCHPIKKKRRIVATKRNVLIARFFLPGRVGTVRMRQKTGFGGWRALTPEADSSEEAADWCYYPDKRVSVRYREFKGLVQVPVPEQQEEEEEQDVMVEEGFMPRETLDEDLKAAVSDALFVLTCDTPFMFPREPSLSGSDSDVPALDRHDEEVGLMRASFVEASSSSSV